jgi:hypothetical protein
MPLCIGTVTPNYAPIQVRACIYLPCAKLASGAPTPKFVSFQDASGGPSAATFDEDAYIISPRHAAPLSADSLKAFADPRGEKDAETMQLEAIQSALHIDVFESPAHKEMIHALTCHAYMLQNNLFEGTNGAHARLLQGPKGIGKSFMLKKICAHLPSGLS